MDFIVVAIIIIIGFSLHSGGASYAPRWFPHMKSCERATVYKYIHLCLINASDLVIFFIQHIGSHWFHDEFHDNFSYFFFLSEFISFYSLSCEFVSFGVTWILVYCHIAVCPCHWHHRPFFLFWWVAIRIHIRAQCLRVCICLMWLIECHA